MKDDTFDSLPPHSIEAEMCLLACLMLDNSQAEQIVPRVKADDFFLPDHKIIFDTIRSLVVGSRPVDSVILYDELKRTNRLGDILGGGAYIARILASIPSASHASEYETRVLEKSSLRKIILSCAEARRRAMAQDGDAAEIAASLSKASNDVTSQRGGSSIIEWANLIDETYDAIGQDVETVPFGFRELDEITGGMAYGETTVIAGRPSLGKSTLVRTIMANAGRAGVPVGVISLEESPRKISRNSYAAEASIENRRLRIGKDLTKNEWNDLAAANARMRKWPIVIEKNARTVDQIRASAFAMKAKYGIKILIVDHLSKVRAPGDSIYAQMTAASGAMSDLVKQINVAGLVLCQLSRKVEDRDDKRPLMSDLRDSGAIEQDADGILLMHRPDYYGMRDINYEPTGILDVEIAKWRDGVRGDSVQLKSELDYQRFSDRDAA